MSLRLATLALGAMLSSGVLMAGENGLMHCFAFTEIADASASDWAAFKKATDDLPNTMQGTVLRVWHGKLARPLNQYRITDAAAAKKINSGEKGVSAPVERLQRSYGVCMQLKDQAALKAYPGTPAHKAWMAVYEKVRVAGTTTYDIVGQ